MVMITGSDDVTAALGGPLVEVFGGMLLHANIIPGMRRIMPHRVSWVYSLIAGTSYTEPGVTPAADVTITFDKWSTLALECGQSRLYGGMHFAEAVNAGHELCTNFMTPVYDNALLLLAGDSSGALHAYNGQDIEVSPKDPSVPIPESTEWYPNWHTQNSHECLNDGNAPQYMEMGEYFEPSELACCETYFGWDVNRCMAGKAEVHTMGGNVEAGTQQWYIDWAERKVRFHVGVLYSLLLLCVYFAMPNRYLISPSLPSVCERLQRFIRYLLRGSPSLL